MIGPHTRVRLALRHGDLLAVRAGAAELGRIDVVDALAIAELIREKEPERFTAATVRWADRLSSQATIRQRPSARSPASSRCSG